MSLGDTVGGITALMVFKVLASRVRETNLEQVQHLAHPEQILSALVAYQSPDYFCRHLLRGECGFPPQVNGPAAVF